MTQYQVIDRDWHKAPSPRFLVDGVNVQFNPARALVGQIIHIALKEDIRPAARRKDGQRQLRLYAPYVQCVLVDPDECTSCHIDQCGPDDLPNTICPNCLIEWEYDWVVRFETKWTSHGNYTSYNTYGCRCPECRLAGKKYLLGYMGKDASNVRSVRAVGGYPQVSV